MPPSPHTVTITSTFETSEATTSMDRRLRLGKNNSLLKLESSVADRTRELLASMSGRTSQRSLSDSFQDMKEILSSSFSSITNNTTKALSKKKRVRNHQVRELEHDDVEVGRLLGKGKFGHVYQIKMIRRRSFLDDIDTDNESDGESSCSVAENFVLKRLNAAVREGDRDGYRAAAADLAFEAKLLSSVSHPNIVRIRGVTSGCEVSALYAGSKNQGNNNGYFIVLDRLECTLKERIEEWRTEKTALKKSSKRHRRSSVLMRRLSSFAGDSSSDDDCSSTTPQANKDDLLLRRLDVARQVAAALSYLHSRRIMYRDLKPDNVGFDAATGQVKIFDFGLARFMPAKDNVQNNKKPTGMAGTPRYMAPEVFRCEHYGTSADVYSFGLLLWEIMALKRPFGKIEPKELVDRVMHGTARPKVLFSKWPSAVCDVMERCWSADPQGRPKLGEVLEILGDLDQ